MKLLGEGGIPKPLVMFGDEKSSISSLTMMPVCNLQSFDIVVGPVNPDKQTFSDCDFFHNLECKLTVAI